MSRTESRVAPKAVFFRFIAAGLLALILASAHAANGLEDAPHVFEFSIMPGTPAWQDLSSHDDMLRVTQMPEGVAKSLSTQDLLNVVLKYPLLNDWLAFNNFQLGFDRVVAGFSGLQELLARPDAGSVILAVYRDLDPAAARRFWSLERQGEYDLRFTQLEMLLSQDSVLQFLSAEERQELLAVVRQKWSAKRSRPEIYGYVGAERSALLMARVMLHEESQSFARLVGSSTILQRFLVDATSVEDEHLLDAISSEADRHLRGSKNSPLGQISAPDYVTSVTTPKGTKVTALYVTIELTEAQKAAILKEIASKYPNATRLTNPTRMYNCHSYAWYSQSSSNRYWINSPGDDAYWKDKSYVLIQTANGGLAIPSAIPNGAKVAYSSSVDHSAIKYSSTEFRSKWGAWPLMQHKPGYCPYACTNCSFSLWYYRKN